MYSIYLILPNTGVGSECLEAYLRVIEKVF